MSFSQPFAKLTEALSVPMAAAGVSDDTGSSSLSDSTLHMYAHGCSLQDMLAPSLIAESLPSHGRADRAAAAADASDDDEAARSVNPNSSSRLTVAPHSTMSLRSTRTGPRPGVSHNPYSCSSPLLDIPVDAEEMSTMRNGIWDAAGAMMGSEISNGMRGQVVLSVSEYALQTTNSNDASTASTAVRVHVKQRVARHSPASTLMQACSPADLSLDPAQLRSLDKSPSSVALGLPSSQYSQCVQGPSQLRTQSLASLRVAARGAVRQHTPYGEYALLPGHELQGKTLMSENGDAGTYTSDAGTDENFLTPRDTMCELRTDASCLHSPSAVPLTSESVSLVTDTIAAGGVNSRGFYDLDLMRRHSGISATTTMSMSRVASNPGAVAPEPLLSSAVSEAPTSMSIASGKRRRRRHSRKSRANGEGGAPLEELAPAMDLVFLPPPPPPLQHLTIMGAPLYGMPSASEGTPSSPGAAAAACDRYRAMVTRWYERAVRSEHSYLVAAYGGTGEVARPCPRREQFLRQSGPAVSGPAAVSALVAWVASMEQWWLECVQPFSFTRRHQALPPSMTAAALAATSPNRAGTTHTHTTGTSSSARLTPLVMNSGVTSIAPGSAVPWAIPSSPSTIAMFSYGASHTLQPAFPTSGATHQASGAPDSYQAVYHTPSHLYTTVCAPVTAGGGRAGAVTQRAWHYPASPQPYYIPPQPQPRRRQTAMARVHGAHVPYHAPRFGGGQWTAPVHPGATTLLH